MTVDCVVTTNGDEAELAGLAASVDVTVCEPAVEPVGTLNCAVKPPCALLVAVATCVLSNLTVIAELAAKPLPVTVT